MATIIKLTDKVTEKLSYLKNLAGVDDSIIDQETKKEIASAVSTIEQEISNARDMINSSQNKNTASHAEICKVEASSWKEPSFELNNLRKISPELINDKNGNPKQGYVKYGLCIKDFKYKNTPKPIWRNLVSIIADNVNEHINDKQFQSLKCDDLRLDYNDIAYSGLFIYKSPITEDGYVRNSDAHIDIWMPKKTEKTQIPALSLPASYCIADGIYPELKGYILSFDEIKSILLNLNNIIYPMPCYHMNGLHDRYSRLLRDSTNGNLYYRDMVEDAEFVDVLGLPYME